MGVSLASAARVAPLERHAPTIATYCSHSSLQIFHGAKQEGFRTLGICGG
ncbi:MAG TPA: DUF1246 domain-containing protein, partial [Thermoplasmata archaeon]|nr:DUF1246 domain-containing protein [Thermoplasmata archaeon]